MSAPIIAFFNSISGVGQTSLVYHLAWMYADMGRRVVVADLDPQADLTSYFLDDERIEAIWSETAGSNTIFDCVEPLLKDSGEIPAPNLVEIEVENVALALLVGDLRIAHFEDDLAAAWQACAKGCGRALRTMSAFRQVIQKSIGVYNADLVLVDTGPNLSAINRAAMISADYLVTPLAPDLFSIQGAQNLGQAIHFWRTEWQSGRQKDSSLDWGNPNGPMQPLGYVTMHRTERQRRPSRAYQRWLSQISIVYQAEIACKPSVTIPPIHEDENRLGTMMDYRNLMSMAREIHKPIFYLKPADGVVGGHYYAVQDAYQDFRGIANQIFASATPASNPRATAP